MDERISPKPAAGRWTVVAAACAVAAAALWPTVGVDAAFVVATLGALAWLWDQRKRLSADFIGDRDDSAGGREADEEFNGEDGRGTDGR